MTQGLVLDPPAPASEEGRGKSEAEATRGEASHWTPLHLERLSRCASLRELGRSFEYYGDDYQRLVSGLALAAERRAAKGDEPPTPLASVILGMAARTVEDAVSALDASGAVASARRQAERSAVEQLGVPLGATKAALNVGTAIVVPPPRREGWKDRGAFRAPGAGELEIPLRTLAAGFWEVTVRPSIDVAAAQLEYWRYLESRESVLYEAPERFAASEATVTVYQQDAGSLERLTGAYLALLTFLTGAGFEAITAQEVRVGSRFERYTASLVGFLSREVVLGNVRRGLRDLFDAVTAKAGEKRKADAEARKAEAGAQIAEFEAKRRADPSVQRAALVKAQAEALSAVERLKQEHYKSEQERLATIKSAEELLARSPELLRKYLLPGPIAALEVRAADEVIGMVASGSFAYLSEGGKVRHAEVRAETQAV